MAVCDEQSHRAIVFGSSPPVEAPTSTLAEERERQQKRFVKIVFNTGNILLQLSLLRFFGSGRNPRSLRCRQAMFFTSCVPFDPCGLTSLQLNTRLAKPTCWFLSMTSWLRHRVGRVHW
jgi:hypothetical protein